MPNCRLHKICGLDWDIGLEGDLCILHSEDPGKDKDRFAATLDAHRKKNGDDFTQIVFPDRADFREAGFTKDASFYRATFTDEADFIGATFYKKADFNGATFHKKANFIRVTFTMEASFHKVTFPEEANFFGATFTDEANFHEATFAEVASFQLATFTKRAAFTWATFTKNAFFAGTKFSGGADFRETLFKGETVDFSFSSFLGRSLFTPRRQDHEIVPTFSGVEVDFTQVVIDPLDALSFRDADLQKCWFHDTDLRKVEMTGVIWPKVGGRFGVYDEIGPWETGTDRPWARIERLYRELKQNYEDRRDYERAGDFHVGEKEIRLKNPDTRLDLRLLLYLYKLISEYGENYRRTLGWIAGLLFITAAITLVGGLRMTIDTNAVHLSPKSLTDWGWALLYGLETMVHLPATEFVTEGGFGRAIRAIASILGPVFIGLFGLALRQRLKR